MRITAVKRWQWLALSVVLGLALWGLRRWDGASVPAGFESLNDPKTFESGLVTRIQGVPLFKDVQVHRRQLDDGSGTTREVHVVLGKYCPGLPERGTATYRWRPTVFVAPIPYHAHGVPGDLAAQGGPSPTVLDLLETLGESEGVRYTHAWWQTYALATWLGGSILLVGVIWPTMINLLVFGRLTRPHEEKGTDLSRVRSAPPQAAPQELSQEDLARLREMERQLEEGLGGATVSDARPAAAAPKPVPVLASGPLDGPVVTPHEDTAFVEKPDDYYPTEDRSAKSRAKRRT